ncbi:MAG TPA: RDD family protein [Jatrophihabitans sp.]|nr:RDD family protein [Jatrophihabitans sp.]
MATPIREPGYDAGVAAGAVIPREARRYQGRRAGLVSRLTANTIDFVVIVVALTAMYLGVCGLLFLWSPSKFRFPSLSSIPVLLIGGVVMVIYLTAGWVSTGRTYGDFLLGIRVVDRRGARMGFMVAAARAVFCTVFPIGILYVAMSPMNRSVQDVVLRTYVIYDWSHEPLSPAHPRG